MCMFLEHIICWYSHRNKSQNEKPPVIPPWKPFPFPFPLYNKEKYLPWDHNLTPFTKTQSLQRKIPKRIGRIYMQRCVYVNTVCSYVLLFQKYFLKRSQVLKYLQKNIYPKLITFPCIFRMFIFSLTILKCSVSKVWVYFFT